MADALALLLLAGVDGLVEEVRDGMAVVVVMVFEGVVMLV